VTGVSTAAGTKSFTVLVLYRSSVDILYTDPLPLSVSGLLLVVLGAGVLVTSSASDSVTTALVCRFGFGFGFAFRSVVVQFGFRSGF